nr:MAG TPA: hypothetical protein [Caudoviricetes sp.]
MCHEHECRWYCPADYIAAGHIKRKAGEGRQWVVQSNRD